MHETLGNLVANRLVDDINTNNRIELRCNYVQWYQWFLCYSKQHLIIACSRKILPKKVYIELRPQWAICRSSLILLTPFKPIHLPASFCYESCHPEATKATHQTRQYCTCTATTSTSFLSMYHLEPYLAITLYLSFSFERTCT